VAECGGLFTRRLTPSEFLEPSQEVKNSGLKKEKTLFKRIDHVALDVADIARSINFYEKNFGCKKYSEAVTGGGQRIAYLRSGDTVLELVNRDAGGMNGFHFCFESDDFDLDVKRLKVEGVPIVTEPHVTEAREKRETGWRRVVFSGPDGERIEFRG